MRQRYSYMVANEGGIELNVPEKMRNVIAEAMHALCLFGQTDEFRILSEDFKTNFLIGYVTDKISLKDFQMKKLEECAPQWANIAYEDGINS